MLTAFTHAGHMAWHPEGRPVVAKQLPHAPLGVVAVLSNAAAAVQFDGLAGGTGGGGLGGGGGGDGGGGEYS